MVSDEDALKICRFVSAKAYTAFPWNFSLITTNPNPTPAIPCVNGLQDYPAPPDLYRLTRAWLNVPTAAPYAPYGGSPNPYPYTDPSPAAFRSAALAAAFVGAQGNGGGTPTALSWPASGSLDVVKRLPPNLNYASYTQIRAICQQPNANLLRLDWATSVPATQPYSLELEYQPIRPQINSLAEEFWFPDNYSGLAVEGILYWLYRFSNDPRAGTTTTENGTTVYSGQLGTWMATIESAAAAEREGSVDSIYPTSPLGNDSYNGGGPWF